MDKLKKHFAAHADIYILAGFTTALTAAFVVFGKTSNDIYGDFLDKQNARNESTANAYTEMMKAQTAKIVSQTLAA